MTGATVMLFVSRQKLEFSYKDAQGYHFMDPESYETITFDESFVGDAKDYLTENQRVDVLYVEGKAANIELPSTVILTVTESPEGVRGDSANNVQKSAVLETGRLDLHGLPGAGRHVRDQERSIVAADGRQAADLRVA